jgi:hypothetical protein
MKTILIIALLWAAASNAVAQSITISSVENIQLCTGDSIIVAYTATGTFNSDNSFKLQISKDSFATFSYVNAPESQNGIISFVLNTSGSYRIRMASSDPYTVSNSQPVTVVVPGYPSPNPVLVSTRRIEYVGSQPFYRVAGLTGQPISLKDAASETAGSTYLWRFSSDATPSTSNMAAPMVEHLTEGLKNASLTVMNQYGCERTNTLQYRVLSCTPSIPANAHIVTGIESGYDSMVWVKTGGSYSALADFNQTVFAEPGSSVTNQGFGGIFYLKTGSSFTSNGSYSVAILNRDAKIPFGGDNFVDTFYCDNVTFDYSLVNKEVSKTDLERLSISHHAPDHLLATSANQPIDLRLLNLLGNEVLSRRGEGGLDIDLTSVPAGIYIAIAESGGQRVTKKIAVIQ